MGHTCFSVGSGSGCRLDCPVLLDGDCENDEMNRALDLLEAAEDIILHIPNKK